MNLIRVFGALLFLAIVSSENTMASFQQNLAEQELYYFGKKAYARRCASCHGDNGNGNGEAAVFLNPKPRDFTAGIFKFKSTPLESLPLDDDLFRILDKGIYGTSMPSFKLVTTQEKLAIIQYVKGFSAEWKNKERFAAAFTGAQLPLEDFSNHNAFIERAKKGRTLYKEACMVCHGRKGYGDGETAADLEDDWGQMIRPANLTKKFIKSGKSIRDIYRVLMSGVGGTPMPSFKDTYTDDQLWDLTAFILYLRGLENGIYSGKSPIKEITQQEVEEGE